MNLLLIEDDENKGIQLGKFVTEMYPFATLVLTRSLQSGIRHIKSHNIDLVLLDMTLPNYDAGPDEPGGGVTHSFGGREFLKQIDRFDIFTSVVVITQFETFGKAPHDIDLRELDEQLRKSYAPVYRGAVYYNSSVHGWREELIKLCDDVILRNVNKGL